MKNKLGLCIIGGCGFCSLLTITFVVLKLSKIVSWSWIWVLAPLWISMLAYVLILVTAVCRYSKHDK